MIDSSVGGGYACPVRYIWRGLRFNAISGNGNICLGERERERDEWLGGYRSLTIPEDQKVSLHLVGSGFGKEIHSSE